MTTGALLLPGGDVVIPAELLAALLFELEAPKQRLPLDVAMPHRTPAIAELVDLTRQGAIAHLQRLRATSRACESLSQPSSVTRLATSAQVDGPSEDGEAVGVAVASGMLGFSPQWMRVLAASGQLPGSRKARGIGNGVGPARVRWRIPLAAVHAYRANREVAR
jgi:ribosomal protein S14